MGIACGGPAAAMPATAIAFISPPVLTTQVEAWSDVLPEMQEIWPEHYAELALNQDKVPLSPRLDAYAAMERHGVLFVMTLRDAGRLVGYFIGFVQPSLHYSSCLECSLDIFFVRPGDRGGRGLLTPGMVLFRATRAELKRRGVQRWFVGSKLHRDASRLFRALGMTPVETYYTQWIGDA